MTRRFRHLIPLVLLALPFAVSAAERPAPVTTRIAEGVYLFQTAPYGEVGLDGNAVAILGPDGVLVFDANGTPSAAAAVLAEIRRLTHAPVRYLVLSHWHWDHWYGAEVYAQAFPDLQIVSHHKTREMMLGPALAFNRPGLEKGLPAYISSLEKKAAGGDAGAKVRLETARFFLSEKQRVRHTVANVTFSDRLQIFLGGREIQVLNRGRAVTPGDVFLYLPAERILVTGDLLVNPVSFALSSYPTEWLQTLEFLDGLDAATIVTGHGEPLRSEDLLQATMEVMRVLLARGREAHARGLSADEARAAIEPELEPLMRRITNGEARLAQPFRVQLVDWYLHRVYDELDGRLTDDIAPIPPS